MGLWRPQNGRHRLLVKCKIADGVHKHENFIFYTHNLRVGAEPSPPRQKYIRVCVLVLSSIFDSSRLFVLV